MTDKSDDLYLPYSVIMRIIRDAVSHVEHLKFQLEQDSRVSFQSPLSA